MSDEELSAEVQHTIGEIMGQPHVRSAECEWNALFQRFSTVVIFDDNSSCNGRGNTQEEAYANALTAAKVHIASRFGA